MSWVDNLEKSNKAFINLVWPVIKKSCGNGNIKPVEIIKDNDIAKDLDVLCGIDIWQTIIGKGSRGIASRVQFGPKNWKTFTVRNFRTSGYKTELQKRLDAINSGGRYIYPYLTCQAYVSKDESRLLGCALAKTKDIYNAIEEGKFVNRTNGDDGTGFIAVRFEDVTNSRIFNFDKDGNNG